MDSDISGFESDKMNTSNDEMSTSSNEMSTSSDIFTESSGDDDDDLVSPINLFSYLQSIRYLNPRISVPKSNHFLRTILPFLMMTDI